jgi:hypothetical protein
MMRTFLAAVVLLLLSPHVIAEGDDAEIWRFRRDEVIRTVDVRGMDAATRQAVVRRLERDGFARVGGGEAVPPLGRDLRADAQRLVRGGGRFSPSERARVFRPPGKGVRPFRPFLGAQVRVLVRDPATDVPGRIARVRPGSLAHALGLRAGDVVLGLDGGRFGAARAALWSDAEALRGQRSLRLRRKDGQIEYWELTFVRAVIQAPRR